jgi:tryptophan synthase alpha chain
MFEAELRERLAEREILLMTHIVLGYPSFEASLALVEAMVEAGVDLMELQIPFSEPIADGPVILHANQRALQAGATVERCLRFAEEVTRRFPIPFVAMSYYNLFFKRGVGQLAKALAAAGVRAAIVPDLPHEEAGEYLPAMADAGLDPVFLFSPSTSAARMAAIAGHARGFVYCVARKGVTGARTDFSASLEAYLARCRAATALPLALGFGVKERADVDALRGRAGIAAVGTETIRAMQARGVAGVRDFVAGLRPEH